MKPELKPCPFCGRKPKIVRDYVREYLGFGARCTIKCKKPFQSPHFGLKLCAETWEGAFSSSVKTWNDCVEFYNKITGEKNGKT